MHSQIRRALCVIATVLAAVLSPSLTASAAADSAGTIHFLGWAGSSYDQFTVHPTSANESWLQAHMWRMIVWSPYFDSNTGWYPNGWMYYDSYAIYPSSTLASAHPEWILHDAAGNKLYIPWGCSNGTCPQYAADIADPAYRAYWIANARSSLARGYRGLFIDDVNMEENVSDGSGQNVAPVDPNTGQPMTATAWRGYMAQFMTEVRAALPGTEIVHNAIWFANNDAGPADPSIKQELQSADYIFLERGVNDAGLTSGTGRWSLNAFLNYVDEVHALGKGVLLAGESPDLASISYNLAAYLLISTGNDAVNSTGQSPTNWWSGFDANLGAATGARYAWDGLLRRDFTGGMALINGPGSPSVTVTLPSPMYDTTSGATVTQVTLGAASGVTLLHGPSTPGAPAQPTTPQSTSTTLQPVTVVSNLAPTVAAPAVSTPTSPTPAPGSAAGAVVHHRSHSGRGSGRARTVLVRVSGRVARATRGQVAIEVKACRAQRCRRYRLGLARVGAGGRFSTLVRVPVVNRLRVRAVYQGTPGYRASFSRYRSVVRKRVSL